MSGEGQDCSTEIADSENNKNVYFDVNGRQRDVWINVNQRRKELSFSLSGGGRGYAKAVVDTTENWDAKSTFIPEKGLIIVYIDHGTIIQEGVSIDVPGIKIGDGQAYLIDLPFVGDEWHGVVEEHVNNLDIHVSAEEKTFWNNKINVDLNEETLILNRN